jgi:hypothetical protein
MLNFSFVYSPGYAPASAFSVSSSIEIQSTGTSSYIYNTGNLEAGSIAFEVNWTNSTVTLHVGEFYMYPAYPVIGSGGGLPGALSSFVVTMGSGNQLFNGDYDNSVTFGATTSGCGAGGTTTTTTTTTTPMASPVYIQAIYGYCGTSNDIPDFVIGPFASQSAADAYVLPTYVQFIGGPPMYEVFNWELHSVVTRSRTDGSGAYTASDWTGRGVVDCNDLGPTTTPDAGSTTTTTTPPPATTTPATTTTTADPGTTGEPGTTMPPPPSGCSGGWVAEVTYWDNPGLIHYYGPFTTQLDADMWAGDLAINDPMVAGTSSDCLDNLGSVTVEDPNTAGGGSTTPPG